MRSHQASSRVLLHHSLTRSKSKSNSESRLVRTGAFFVLRSSLCAAHSTRNSAHEQQPCGSARLTDERAPNTAPPRRNRHDSRRASKFWNLPATHSHRRRRRLRHCDGSADADADADGSSSANGESAAIRPAIWDAVLRITRVVSAREVGPLARSRNEWPFVRQVSSLLADAALCLPTDLLSEPWLRLLLLSSSLFAGWLAGWLGL